MDISNMKVKDLRTELAGQISNHVAEMNDLAYGEKEVLEKRIFEILTGVAMIGLLTDGTVTPMVSEGKLLFTVRKLN